MTTQWLQQHGISRQMLARYKQAGWLENLAHGVWHRPGQKISWQGAVEALQSQLQLPVWPAGRSALELLGQAHYIPLSDHPPVQLGQGTARKLPSWFAGLDMMRNLQTFNATSLFEPAYAGLTDWRQSEVTLRISTPERAILELCHLLPGRTDTEEVGHLMAGLPGLRPKRLRQLLLVCQSIKAKRLFMALAEHAAHPWLSSLDVTGVDFGTGKRSLPLPGKLHPTYQITVPEVWLGHE